MKGSAMLLPRGKNLNMILLLSRASIMIMVATATTATITPASENNNIVMIPKYKQSNHEQMVLGAKLAQKELGDAPNVVATYPSRENSLDDQISMVKDATNHGVKAIMIANNAGEQVENYTLRASQLGIPVVTYDSPLAHGKSAGESLFVSPVDFRETGVLMAEMAYHILGMQQNGFYSMGNNGPAEGGEFVILSTTPDAANQNGWIQYLKDAIAGDDKYSKLTLAGEEVYYPRADNAAGYEEITLELVELKKNGTFPNLSLIMAPTTSGAASAARALHEHGHCDVMQVSGLAQPVEMLKAAMAGCAPAFALFNNLDVGYLAYHATHALVSGRIEGKEGDVIDAGRLGIREVMADPSTTRDNGLWVIAGEFVSYNVENVERAAFVDCIMDMDNCSGAVELEDHFIEKYKKKALAIIPKVTGMLSFICSAFLVQHILRSKTQRNSPYSRIILGLSTADMFSSFFGFFLSTWPMPSETWLAYGAAGTIQSCTMQGFFVQLGLCAATLYQASLVSYYFLTIVKGWRKTRIRRWEPIFHVIPCTVALGTAVAGLFLQLYNPMTRGSMCWIKEYPPYCGESMSCERGEHALEYRWGFLYGFVVATFTWLACAMMTIYHNIRTTEDRTSKYRHSHDSSAHKQSREVAAQALLYSLAYSIPWIWGLILSSINTAEGVFCHRGIDNAITALNIVNVIIFPLQGFLNVMVYVRPRYLEARKKDPEASIFLMTWRTLDPNAEEMPSIRLSYYVSDGRRRSIFGGRRRTSLFQHSPNPVGLDSTHPVESTLGIATTERAKVALPVHPEEEIEDQAASSDSFPAS